MQGKLNEDMGKSQVNWQLFILCDVDSLVREGGSTPQFKVGPSTCYYKYSSSLFRPHSSE